MRHMIKEMRCGIVHQSLVILTYKLVGKDLNIKDFSAVSLEEDPLLLLYGIIKTPSDLSDLVN